MLPSVLAVLFNTEHNMYVKCLSILGTNRARVKAKISTSLNKAAKLSLNLPLLQNGTSLST